MIAVFLLQAILVFHQQNVVIVGWSFFSAVVNFYPNSTVKKRSLLTKDFVEDDPCTGSSLMCVAYMMFSRLM